MPPVSRRNAVRFAFLLSATPAFTLPASATEEALLAIKGYDPVAYFTLGRAERGVPGLEYEWDELRYRFVSAEHRDMFKSDPVRFVPQFANFCAMALTRGEVVESNPENWLINDGKLYLFGKVVGPELLRRDFPDNLAKAMQYRWMIQKR